ncbi:MAG: ATP-binding cassette domain-containing protein, partial [Bacteroidota bacterium]
SIPARTFVALMGPSGCGKTTLLKCLNGDGLPSQGKVSIQGLELNKDNFNLLKRNIGYVPQDDIIHRALTVEDTMFFAAKLRLPDDTKDAEIKERIDAVLEDLNINDQVIRSTLVGELSGGQRKRVSIAVELLAEPSILFLDEPTSPLDPETIDDFLNCIKKLTEKGTTVIMVTHKPSDLEYVDQVIFLGTKGYINYFGSPNDIYTYFGQREKNVVKIYALLSKESEAKRGYHKLMGSNVSQTNATLSNQELGHSVNENLFLQYFWLSKRYFQIKWNDKWNMMLLLAQPVIIAVLLAFIFNNLESGVLFLMAISAVWFGVSNAAKEIVGEKTIYRRERMFNLNIFTYLFSKITILSLIALAQVVIFVAILFIKYNIGDEQPVQFRSYASHTIFMFYLSLSATFLGLLLSAIFSNTEKVMTFIPIALIPQIMLAGVVAKIDTPMKELFSYATLGRWGTEMLCRIQDRATSQADYELWKKNDDDFERMAETTSDSSGVYFLNENDEEILASVMAKKPEILSDATSFSIGGSIEEPAEALETLDFYDKDEEEEVPTDEDEESTDDEENLEEEDTTLAWFNSLKLNLLIVSALNLGVFISLFLVLKRKDDI